MLSAVEEMNLELKPALPARSSDLRGREVTEELDDDEDG